MQPIVRVFVSSTWLDLQPERLAVEKALQRMRQTKLNGMEYFGSRDETTRQVSLDEVDRSDVYVGIIGGRYGSGITEDEYRRASEKKLPRFIYFKDEQHIRADGRDPEDKKQTRLATWKEDLRKAHALGTGPFTSPDDLAARVTADLSNWLLDQWGPQLYLHGVGALPYDYAGRIENFLIEYLGSATTPVPFGGREKDLKALDAWLDDATAPPYLLMAAPAGRGKSALLVRWTRQLLARAHISLVFVPISIRFRTNLSGVTFAALAARLATLHGETIPNTPSTSVEVWRGLVTDYLRRPLPNGETLVVVLDGLDEAADWEPGPDLFPLNPPDHVRVVVSARYRAGDEDARGWLRQLEWKQAHLARSYDLDLLTREGMVRALESMGCPLDQLSAKVDIVSELYRLTEGDPLMVRLYVEDLWSHKERVATLKPEDLGALKPGLEGYFNRWWDDQRTLWDKESPLKERNVQALMNVLACSLGPLNKGDVLHLTKLSSWDLEEALRPLNRFITGDGKTNGYAFSHPRLGYYFKDKLSAREQQDWAEKFLAWGRDTVRGSETGTLAPGKAPPYIVQYYGAHLEQAHASAEMLLTLVCHGWSKVWEALEGSFTGFLNDVERAWKAAERENEQAIKKGNTAPHIGAEIRCALVRASINSLAAKIPVTLIVQLVKHQKWTVRQGMSYVRQIPETRKRAEAFVQLITELEMPDDLRDQMLMEALAAARKLPSARGLPENEDRAEKLAELIPHLPEKNRALVLHEALAETRQLEDIGVRALVVAKLAPHLPEKDRTKILRKALSGARLLADNGRRAEVLAKLAQHLPEKDRTLVLREALAAARQMKDDEPHFFVLPELAPHLPQDVLAAARQVKDDVQRAWVLALLVPHLPEKDRAPVLQEALAAARLLEDDYHRPSVLTELVPHLPEKDRTLVLQETLAAARLVGTYMLRVYSLTKLVPHLPEKDRTLVLLEALTTIRQLRDNGRPRAEVLTALAPHISGKDRNKILQEALSAARLEWDDWQRAELLTKLVPHLPEKDRPPVIQETLTAARHVKHARTRAWALTALAPHLPEKDCSKIFREALAAARLLEDDWERTGALTELAPHLPEKDRLKSLQEALAAARLLKKDWQRADVLTALTPYLPEKNRKKILQEALTAARLLEEDWQRADALTALAPHLRLKILREALAATRQLQDDEHRAEALMILASDLPERDRKKILQEALVAARLVEDDWRRAYALTELASHLPEKDRKKILREAFREPLPAAWLLELHGERTWMLTALAPHLAALDQPIIFSVWRTTFRDHFPKCTRADLMSDLAALVPIINALGGCRALETTAQDIRDVAIWWP